MNFRLTLAAMVLSLGVLSFSCGTMPKADAGTGGGIGTGGGTGGGAATGGGTGRTCVPAPAFTQADLQGKAGYDPGGTMSLPVNYALLGRPSPPDAGRFDILSNELYVDGPLNKRRSRT